MKRNPIAVLGLPMGITVCTCKHIYIQHIFSMPSSPLTDRQCLVEGCPCLHFATTTNAQVTDVEPLSPEQIEAEYKRLDALDLLESAGG